MAARLILWDVDLTLVDARGLGERWYRTALAESTGRALERMPDAAGRTELSIASEVLRTHGVEPDEGAVEAIFTALASAVSSTRDELAARGRALPGAAAALTALDSAPFVQTVVTGNLASVATHKLAAFDLHHRLDLDIGGFGTDSVHRHDLIAAAVAKASAKHATPFAPDSVVVIGDTPHDIAGARRFGAVPVGVATGSSSVDELHDSGAHVVLPDLADTGAVLRAASGVEGDRPVSP